MSTILPDNPILAGLKVVDLARYFRSQGWNVVSHPNDKLRVFTGKSDDSGRDITVVIPNSTDLKDFAPRVSEAVNLLAAVENRPAQQVLDSIAKWDRDILRVRLGVNFQSNQSIPMELAGEILPLLRKFLSDAACTEDQPKPFFAKATAIGKSFTETCQFGHTFSGSFGLTIECPLPLDPNLSLPNIQSTKPFERRVVERIAAGYEKTNEAASSGSSDVIVDSFQKAFNANMCETLTDLYEAVNGREMEYSISWCPELKPSPQLAQSPVLRLEHRTYEHLKIAARKLEHVREFEDIEIVGKVVALRAEDPLAEAALSLDVRHITMHWEIERGTFIRLRVPLQAHEYQEACDAHKNGRKIAIKGRPEKQAKFWTLAYPHDFRVLT